MLDKENELQNLLNELTKEELVLYACLLLAKDATKESINDFMTNEQFIRATKIGLKLAVKALETQS